MNIMSTRPLQDKYFSRTLRHLNAKNLNYFAFVLLLTTTFIILMCHLFIKR
jgi:ABC-type multidrug transport system permease subunit